jgi:hypothetical protein
MSSNLSDRLRRESARDHTFTGMRSAAGHSGPKTTVAIVAVLVATLMAGCTGKKHQPSPTPRPGTAGVSVKITPSKPEYAPGEPVVLTIELTNNEPKACRVSKIPDGAIAVVSLTRDGTAVAPTLSSGDYPDGFASFLRANQAQLAPNVSASLVLRSEENTAVDGRPALDTSTMDGQDGSTLVFWPVDTAGRYALAIRYVPTELTDAAGNACQASGEPASTEFTVRT